MIKEKYFNLRQFGEGGGDSGDASHDSGEVQVVYGKQEESSVDTHEGDNSHDADGEEDEQKKRKAEFEKLIKGEYKDLYDESVKSNIDRRFKNANQSRHDLERVNTALLPLYDKYGIDVGDVESLENAIQSDMTLYADEAEEMGLTPEQYAYIKQTQISERRATNELEQLRGSQEAQRMYQGWLSQGEELKAVYPEFDLATEVQNEKFMALLRQDWSVADAYEAIHAKELITRGIGTAAEAAQKNVVSNIRARGMRPSENGTGSKPGVIVKKDPSQFDNKDMEEIRRRVANGEKISF